MWASLARMQLYPLLYPVSPMSHCCVSAISLSCCPLSLNFHLLLFLSLCPPFFMFFHSSWMQSITLLKSDHTFKQSLAVHYNRPVTGLYPLIPVPVLYLLAPASLHFFDCKILCNVAATLGIPLHAPLSHASLSPPPPFLWSPAPLSPSMV